MTTPAPTTTEEAYNQWSAQLYQDLTTHYVDTEWANLILPADTCLDSISTAIFSVDLDSLTSLCSQVAGCTFTAENYVPYAFGFRFTLSST